MKLIKPSFEIMQYDSNPLKQIELVARNCYKSEDKITDNSAEVFVKKLYDRGHHAMLEFYPLYFLCDYDYANTLLKINNLPDINGDLMIYNKVSEPFTQVSCNLRTVIMISKYNGWLAGAVADTYPSLKSFFTVIRYNYPANSNPCVLVPSERVEDFLKYLTVRIICDRGVTHELVRHRKCSFAQESTRYCNYGKGDVTFIIPEWLESYNESQEVPHPYLVWYDSMQDSEIAYKQLLDEGWSPQQARSILPNSLKTEIIIQAKLSEWKHIFEQRCAKGAHPQMREVMIPLQEEVRKLYPNYFEV